jgi:hypothetical protein
VERAPKWVRDLLIIPIVVGIVLAVIGYSLPKFFERGKRLGYTLDGPVEAFRADATAGLSLTVDGIPVTRLFTYRLRLWNSGDESVRDAPVRIVFASAPGFRVFSVRHATAPAYEFGRIVEETPSAYERRFVYSLLNPTNEDVVTFVTNAPASASLYVNIDGVRVSRVETALRLSWLDSASTFASISGLLFAFLGLLTQSQATKIYQWLRRRIEASSRNAS